MVCSVAASSIFTSQLSVPRSITRHNQDLRIVLGLVKIQYQCFGSNNPKRLNVRIVAEIAFLFHPVLCPYHNLLKTLPNLYNRRPLFAMNQSVKIYSLGDKFCWMGYRFSVGKSTLGGKLIFL